MSPIALQKRYEIVFLSLHPKGPQWNHHQVASYTHTTENSVRYWLQRFKENPDLTASVPSGRKRKTSEKEDNLITTIVATNPTSTIKDIQEVLKKKKVEVSESTISRRLRESGYKHQAPTLKPLLTETHIERRKAWAEQNSQRDWSKVVFSDETTFHAWTKPRHVWKKPGQHIIFRTVKHSVKLHAWGCFSRNGFGRLITFSKNLNAKRLLSIYQLGLVPSLTKLGGPNSDLVLQEDNDSKHTSKLAKEWRATHNITRMDWPACSPDMNPIENVWQLLKLKVHKRHPFTKKQLEAAIHQEWKALPRDYAKHLVDSMERRLQALKESKGDFTLY
jgi:transposase